MKNKLSDLNNHLFEQLERLGDEDLTAEELEKERVRATSIATIAKIAVENAKLALEAEKFLSEYGIKANDTKLIGIADDKTKS